MSLKNYKPKDLDTTKIQFNVDLEQQANKFFDLLETFEDFTKQFPNTDVLKSNITEGLRDYSLFMKLQAENPIQRLVPTTMIELIWISHLLRNEVYRKDCKEKFGYIPIHSMEYPDRMKMFRETSKLWKSKYNFPYMQSAPKSSDIDLKWIGITSQHVFEDCQWLKELIKVRPDYRDSEFLKKNQEYYIKCLYIWAKETKTTTDGPHIGIDIFWHSHILSMGYEEDCKKLVGFVPNHYPKTKTPIRGASNNIPVVPYEYTDLSLDQLFIKNFGVRMSFSFFELDPSASDPVSKCPKEIFSLILDNFQFEDILNCAGVSKQWRSITEHAPRWKTLYKQIAPCISNSLGSDQKKKIEIQPSDIDLPSNSHREFMYIFLKAIELCYQKEKDNEIFIGKKNWFQNWFSRQGREFRPPTFPLMCAPPPTNPPTKPIFKKMCKMIAPKHPKPPKIPKTPKKMCDMVAPKPMCSMVAYPPSSFNPPSVQLTNCSMIQNPSNPDSCSDDDDDNVCAR